MGELGAWMGWMEVQQVSPMSPKLRKVPAHDLQTRSHLPARVGGRSSRGDHIKLIHELARCSAQLVQCSGQRRRQLLLAVGNGGEASGRPFRSGGHLVLSFQPTPQEEAEPPKSQRGNQCRPEKVL